MKRLIALLILALLGVAVVLAMRVLPWWAIVAGLVLLVLIGKLLIGRLFKKLLLAPFRAKRAAGWAISPLRLGPRQRVRRCTDSVWLWLP